MDISALVTALGVLVTLTNVIVQVVKKVLSDRFPTPVLAVIVSQLLTLAAFFGWCAYSRFDFCWYHIIAAVVSGFMVAYAAMFGFEKLKSMFQ